MCGRFNVIESSGLQQLLRGLGVDQRLSTRSNIAPTDSVSLVRRGVVSDGLANEMTLARWWLTPSWSKGPDQKYAMFNARSETLSESRAWRTPFLRQRGILPMSSFIEWRSEAGVRQPYRVSNPEAAIAVGALWDQWREPGAVEVLMSCAIVTTAAATEFSHWHTRMPVMLQPQDVDRWLDNKEPIAADDPLFEPRLHVPLEIAMLDSAINNARNKSPDLLKATGDVVRVVPSR